MKKILSLFIMLTLIMIIVGCKQNSDESYIGLNAEIININSDLKGFTVKVMDDNELGEKCYINLENEDVYFIYANNETNETQDLEYSDFVVGDIITIDTDKVENKSALAKRIQLITQRIK